MNYSHKKIQVIAQLHFPKNNETGHFQGEFTVPDLGEGVLLILVKKRKKSEKEEKP